MKRIGGWALTLVLSGVACSKSGGSTTPERDAATAGADAGADTSPDVPGDAPVKLEPAMNTKPFNDGVYLRARWAPVTGAVEGLQRFWPSRATSYYAGFDPDPEYMAFRSTDGQLFYGNSFYGVHIDDSATGPDTEIPTPPCVHQAGTPFLINNVFGPIAFDGQGRLYYQCLGIRRGNGELQPGQPAGLAGVLPDGRKVVIISDPNGDPTSYRFAAMAPDGQILSELNLGYPPPYVPNPDSFTANGNDAFVLVTHIEYDANMDPYDVELVGYRLDAQSRWLKVRTVPYVRQGRYWDLLLSDGTILSWSENQPDPGSQIIAFLPDGTQRTVWHLADSPGAYFSPPQMVVGPREPSGPSLRQE